MATKNQNRPRNRARRTNAATAGAADTIRQIGAKWTDFFNVYSQAVTGQSTQQLASVKRMLTRRADVSDWIREGVSLWASGYEAMHDIYKAAFDLYRD
jgi:hypothetical protein